MSESDVKVLQQIAGIVTKSTMASEMIEFFSRHLDKKVAGLKGYATRMGQFFSNRFYWRPFAAD